MHFQALSVGIRAPTHHFNGTVLACSASDFVEPGGFGAALGNTVEYLQAEHRSDRREDSRGARLLRAGPAFETDGVDDECV